MKKIQNYFNIKNSFGIFVLFISYFIFYSILKFKVKTDIEIHNFFVNDFEKKVYPDIFYILD
ncbi:MAG: hypothetical protein B6I24_07435 [Bacteroidetes bacterium 4572_128]|nr:MAG: hypothetical protein B6I24_07435 [Bacteroidetes bacterium 4572_128]